MFGKIMNKFKAGSKNKKADSESGSKSKNKIDTGPSNSFMKKFGNMKGKK